MSDENMTFAPPFVRLNYFHGQMLSAQDFRTEQAYFRHKRRLLNRMVLGHGVAYGLDVTLGAVVAEHCPPGGRGRSAYAIQTEIARLRHRQGLLRETGCNREADALQADIDALLRELADLDEAGGAAEEGDAAAPRGLVVTMGYGLDCHGNELVVRDAVGIDPFAPDDDGNRVTDGFEGDTGLLLLSVCYAEEPLHPTRPMGADACDDAGEVHFARIRETVRLKLEPTDLAAVEQRRRAEPCNRAEGCGCGCLALAVVTVQKRNGAWTIDTVDKSVRRPIGLYDPTRIVGISWLHGSTYSWDATPGLLQAGADGEGGLEVYFSRPVIAPPDLAGVVDLVLTTGGDGMAGGIRHIATAVTLKDDNCTLRIRQASRERFNDGDRITLTVRTSQLLDKCGRTVQGANLGGLVPPLDRRPQRGLPPGPELAGFDLLNRHFQPWHTGAGGDFVSWIHLGTEQP